MSFKQPDSAIRETVACYMEGIAVPDFDAAAIGSRGREQSAARTVGSAPSRRRMLGALVVAGLVIAILPKVPAVVAQVQHVLQAFTLINGKTVPMTVREVSLEQARQDMPFHVIAPAAIPSNLRPTIREIYASPTRADARVMFDYPGARGPGLMITETANHRAEQGPVRLWMSESTPKEAQLHPMPSPPAGAKGMYWIAQFKGNAPGGETKTIRVRPLSWTVGGTRLVLVNPPGLLTQGQVEAIREAMSR